MSLEDTLREGVTHTESKVKAMARVMATEVVLFLKPIIKIFQDYNNY